MIPLRLVNDFFLPPLDLVTYTTLLPFYFRLHGGAEKSGHFYFLLTGS